MNLNTLNMRVNFKRDDVKIICNVCGGVMKICGSEPPYYAHCLNRECKERGHNNIVFSGFLDAQLIAEDWLLEKFQEYDWRKKDGLEWLNHVWKEYQEWCRDNY